MREKPQWREGKSVYTFATANMHTGMELIRAVWQIGYLRRVITCGTFQEKRTTCKRICISQIRSSYYELQKFWIGRNESKVCACGGCCLEPAGRWWRRPFFMPLWGLSSEPNPPPCLWSPLFLMAHLRGWGRLLPQRRGFMIYRGGGRSKIRGGRGSGGVVMHSKAKLGGWKHYCRLAF